MWNLEKFDHRHRICMRLGRRKVFRRGNVLLLLQFVERFSLRVGAVQNSFSTKKRILKQWHKIRRWIIGSRVKSKYFTLLRISICSVCNSPRPPPRFSRRRYWLWIFQNFLFSFPKIRESACREKNHTEGTEPFFSVFLAASRGTKLREWKKSYVSRRKSDSKRDIFPRLFEFESEWRQERCWVFIFYAGPPTAHRLSLARAETRPNSQWSEMEKCMRVERGKKGFSYTFVFVIEYEFSGPGSKKNYNWYGMCLALVQDDCEASPSAVDVFGGFCMCVDSERDAFGADCISAHTPLEPLKTDSGASSN